MTVLADRAAAATGSWEKRIRNPVASRRWKEIATAEQEITNREQRLHEADLSLARARERLVQCEQDDAARLERWRTEGGEGERPEASAIEARARVTEREQQFEDRARAVEAAEEARRTLIERRRKTITADAKKLVGERAERARQLIVELRQARAELVEAAAYQAWSLVYPHESAGSSPDYRDLGAGVAKPYNRLQIKTRLPVDRLFEAMEDDVEIVCNLLTAEQRAALVATGELPRDARKEASWIGPDDAAEERRRRLEELAQAAAKELGVERERLTEEQFDNWVAEVAEREEGAWSA